MFESRRRPLALSLLLSAWLIALPGMTAAAETQNSSTANRDDTRATAIFAGGCFWCMEPPFDKVDGVISTTSGYTGGDVRNPSYKQVSAGDTGHTEAVEVVYDPRKVDYAALLTIFWRNIDPLDAGGQFCDRGSQYRSEVFYLDEEQEKLALASRDRIEASGRFEDPIATAISAASTFYPAENYHQNYYRKNPLRYKYYRYACGQDKRLEELWGKAD